MEKDRPAPLTDTQALSLEVERERTREIWESMVSQDVPMAVAAATTFHQVDGSTKAIVARGDYDDALNISASALSRLVPVYALDAAQKRTEVPVNLLTHRFAHGATKLRSPGGETVENLYVGRADLLFAIAIIKRAGLAFGFSGVPDERPDTEVERRG